MSADEAWLFLGDVRDRLTIVTLNTEEYGNTIKEAAALGIVGGGIYDALLAHCALKANGHAIYTWNRKHFERLGPQISRRVRNP